MIGRGNVWTGFTNKLLGGSRAASESPVDLLLRWVIRCTAIGVVAPFGSLEMLGGLGTELRRCFVPETGLCLCLWVMTGRGGFKLGADHTRCLICLAENDQQ